MKWYLVKLIFSIESESRSYDASRGAEFDEQLRLVQDFSQELALLKARRLGRSLETTFLNNEQKQMRWRFVDVHEVVFIGDIEDGVELCSNTIEADNRERFIHGILLRSLNLGSKTVLQ